MKKIVFLVILIAAMLVACVPSNNITDASSSGASFVQGVPTDTVPVSAPQPEKSLCEVTLDEAFDDHTILVVVYPQWNHAEYHPDNFSSVGCIKVEERGTFGQDDEPNRIIELTLDQNSKQNVLDCIRVLEAREDVYRAQPQMEGFFTLIPNDVKYMTGAQWAIDKLSLPDAWDISTGSNDVLVGIVDTGIDVTHPDLAGRVDQELSRSFSPVTDNPLEDIDGHGTSVASIIGATTNNSIGMAGAAWNVKLVSLRIEKNSGHPDREAIIEAINYAEDNNIPILVCSITFYDSFSASGIDTAISNYSGLIVVAAGNDCVNCDDNPHYPACYSHDNIIAVGGSRAADTISQITNWGVQSVDIFAPGQVITVARPGGQYASVDGTSVAAPYVAATAALLLSIRPDLSITEIKTAIMEHADTIYDQSGNSIFGPLCVSGGRLNAYKVLQHFTVSHYEYRYNTSLINHEAYCPGCMHTIVELHQWVHTQSYSYCSKCGMTTNRAPVVEPWRLNEKEEY